MMNTSSSEYGEWTLGPQLMMVPRVNSSEHRLFTKGESSQEPAEAYLVEEHGGETLRVIAFIDGERLAAWPCDRLPEAGEARACDTSVDPLIRVSGDFDGATGQLTIRQSDGHYRRYSRVDRIKGAPGRPAAVVRTLPQCGCGGYLGAPMMFDSFAEMIAYFYAVFTDANEDRPFDQDYCLSGLS